MLKIKTNRVLFVFLAMSFSSYSFAANCDCTQKIGKCSGAINFLKKFGSPPSYGAEFEVYSSEKTCSKVEYFVDNLPNQTILSNKNKELESAFGTKPITAESIVYSACYVCKNLDEKNEPSSAKSNEKEIESPFNGRWVASDRNIMGFTNTTTYDVTVRKNMLTGTFVANGNSGSLSGTVSGNKATVKCSGCFTVTWTLLDDRTIRYSYPFGSGTIRKE